MKGKEKKLKNLIPPRGRRGYVSLSPSIYSSAFASHDLIFDCVNDGVLGFFFS